MYWSKDRDSHIYHSPFKTCPPMADSTFSSNGYSDKYVAVADAADSFRSTGFAGSVYRISDRRVLVGDSSDCAIGDIYPDFFSGVGGQVSSGSRG